MKSKLYYAKSILLAFSILLTIGIGQAFAQNTGEQKDKPKISADEQMAAKKIEEAADVAAKIQATKEFLAKYPKSELRKGIAEHITDAISRLSDENQKVTYGEQFFSTFTETSETDLISPYLIESYLLTKKLDEAFQVGESYLSRNADDVIVLSQLATYGAIQAQQGNGKYMAKSIQFGNKAIELIEANKKPANLVEEKWEGVKAANLPSLYQSLGAMLLQSGKHEEAKTKLAKAAELSPTNPVNYYLLGVIDEEEYKVTAKAYQAAAPGKQKDDLLVKANAQLDKVIDYFARAIGAADGKAEHKNFATQLRQDVEVYYKYRHNNSLNGLQELINKYKTTSLTLKP